MPLLVIAARAGVSETTARLFEIDADEVKNVDKRAALASVYDDLRVRLPAAWPSRHARLIGLAAVGFGESERSTNGVCSPDASWRRRRGSLLVGHRHGER